MTAGILMFDVGENNRLYIWESTVFVLGDLAMTAEMKSVYSSHVDEIGYDAEKQELVVKFTNGRTAIYEEVPPEKAIAIMASPSIGEALSASIRGKFPFRYA